MDNSHISHVSQQCQSLLLPRPPQLLPPQSSHTKKSVRRGLAGKHRQTGVHVHVCVHTHPHPHPHTLPISLSPLQRNGTECGKKEGGSKHWRKSSSFTAGSHEKSPGVLLQHKETANRPSATWLHRCTDLV